MSGASETGVTLRSRRVVVLATVAALVAFLPSLADGFVFDDDILIVNNPFAHEWRYLPRCFTTDLWDTPERPVADASTKFYRPLVCASYVANFELGGGRPWSFHLTNVLLHAGVTALIARLALRWTGSPLAALVAAVIFATHPSRSENVIWVSGRTDILMALFLLVAHELAVSGSARTGPRWAWVGAAVAWILALLSKEFAVCWPVLLLIERIRATEQNDRSETRRLSAALAASAVGAVLYLAVRSRFYPIRPPEIETMALPLPLHVSYVFLSLGYYAERVVFPWPQTFHFRPVAIEHGTPILYTRSIVVGVVAALALAFWLFRASRRDRILAAILFGGVVLLLPIINVSYTGFPGTTADRFLYLPLLLFAIAAARDARPHLQRWFSRSRVAPLVVGSGALLYAGINWERSLDYASNEALWRHEIEINPDNPMALAGLAGVLAANDDTDGAVKLLEQALAPRSSRYRLLASPTRYYVALLELEASRVADGNVAALRDLLDTIVAMAEGRVPENRRIGDLDVGPPLDDEHFRIHAANAKTHLCLAGAFVASRLGRDDLVHSFARAVRGDPTVDSTAHYNLALALARASDFEAARRELELAQHAPSSPGVDRAARGLLSLLESVRAAEIPAGSREAVLARAHAYFELGAYLRAARELRPLYLENVRDRDVAAAYLDALVWARLDSDAARAAQLTFGDDKGKATVAGIQRMLTPHTARAIAPEPGSVWWM